MNYVNAGELIIINGNCYNSFLKDKLKDRLCIFLSERITKWSSDHIFYNVLVLGDDKISNESILIPLHNLKLIVKKC